MGEVSQLKSVPTKTSIAPSSGSVKDVQSGKNSMVSVVKDSTIQPVASPTLL